MSKRPRPENVAWGVGAVVAAVLFSPFLSQLLVNGDIGLANRLMPLGMSDRTAFFTVVLLEILLVFSAILLFRRTRALRRLRGGPGGATAER